MLGVRLTAGLLQGLQQQATAAAGAAWFATKASSSAKASDNLVPAKDWKAVKLPAQTTDSMPVTKYPGQAFVGDLRWVSPCCGWFVKSTVSYTGSIAHVGFKHSSPSFMISQRAAAATGAIWSDLSTAVVPTSAFGSTCAGQQVGWARVTGSTTTPTNGCRQVAGLN